VVDPTPMSQFNKGYDPTNQHYMDGPEDLYCQVLEVEEDDAEGVTPYFIYLII